MSDLRDIERASIRAFVQSAADEGYLSGRVLDYGCGKQPYRDIVEAAAAEYLPWDGADLPANVSGEDIGSKDWRLDDPDGILCTQVLQYVRDVPNKLREFAVVLRGQWHNEWQQPPREHRYLVLTYPTNWPEVEPEDLHRFTKAGMERLLTEAGFTIVWHPLRAVVTPVWASTTPIRNTWEGDQMALGYGVVARA